MKIIVFILLLLVSTVTIAQKRDKKRDTFYTGLEISLITLNIIDYGTTVYALSKIEGAVEGNPLMVKIVKNPYALGAFKASILTGTLLLNRKIYKDDTKFAKINLIILNAAFGFIAYNNINIVLKF